jgi:hypothetical protein
MKMLGLVVAINELRKKKSSKSCQHSFVKDEIDKGGIICKYCGKKIPRAIMK